MCYRKEHKAHSQGQEEHTMTEKTARQIAEMKKQTIGVEIEMNNMKRSRAAKIAADFFGTGRYENTAGRNGYSTWSAWDADGREWKFQKDVSISGPKMRTGHTDPYLRRHRNPAGALQTAPTCRRKERCRKGMRSPHPHRGKGTHGTDLKESRQHYGEPREPDRRSP